MSRDSRDRSRCWGSISWGVWDAVTLVYTIEKVPMGLRHLGGRFTAKGHRVDEQLIVPTPSDAASATQRGVSRATDNRVRPPIQHAGI